MKTMILARNRVEADRYQLRNCLFGAKIADGLEDLKPDTRRVVLVGAYWLHSEWKEIEAKICDLINRGSLVVDLDEWPE